MKRIKEFFFPYEYIASSRLGGNRNTHEQVQMSKALSFM